jgi:chromosome segregation protein
VFLKSLTLKGFKSFAESADLELEPGITVVVGPNGSGKSNVVDAMAWVLGAQAPSSVRSQKMDDVIFAGTSSKKPLGRAEVSLTIDNSDGQLPIDYSEVMLTRTLYRSGESDYAINGTSCRLLDIQELLSDSGVGRQQHIIVSQGRIDDVLNARPEDRRAIIEEAAGVLKYRKRRERAERRLTATGENLARLQDLLREVKRQIRPLERQAEAARRHGTLVEELTGLKIHLAGRQLSALRGQLETGRRLRRELEEREGGLTSRLARLDAAVLEGESELSALGASDVADVLSRAKSMAERVRGQRNVVGERRTRLEGELQAAVDDGVVANLEAEAARMAAEITVAQAEIENLQPELAALAESEERLNTEQLTFDTEWGDSLAPAPNRAAELRTRITALAEATERNDHELKRLTDRIQAVDQRHISAIEARDRAQRTIDDHDSRRPESEREQADVAGRVGAAVDQVEQLQEQRRHADRAVSRWQARAEALEQALDDVRSRAGVDALRDTEGVLGTLLDLVEIDDGWEAAVEAAVGDALLAVVVDSPQNARQALEALEDKDLAGGVLALGAAAPTPIGSVAAGRALRPHVRASRPDVNALLDALLGRVAVLDGGWRPWLHTILDHPDQVFVTAEGDRFSRRGWRLRQGGTGATGAALEEARSQEAEAGEHAATVADRLQHATLELEQRQHDQRKLDQSLRQATAEFDRAVSARDQASAEIARLEADRRDLIDQRHEVVARRRDDADQLEALTTELPAAENEESEHRSRAEALALSRTSLEERARAVATKRTELEVRLVSIEERRDQLIHRRHQTEARLERLVNEREQARDRRVRIEAAIAAVAELDQRLTEHQGTLGQWVEVLEAEQRAQSEAARRVSADLSARRGERVAAEKELSELRERHNRLELDDTEHRVKLETLTEALRRELDTDPEIAMTTECPDYEGDATPEARVRELERELKIMGPINPLALEEFEELKERRDFLDSQLNDVKSARRELHKLIRSIDDEIVTVFTAAFADVATNFSHLFTTLFPGGKGSLVLTNSDDILNCGIEIEGKPSGKNVKKLSLLSGGERALVALAFLFAVFRSRPSPFYVMDEVEAALDDMNLSRFLALVEEFRKEAQLIIVSHQKRTMEAADVLYGVSMKPGGSSKVVTERVTERHAGRIPDLPPPPAVDQFVVDQFVVDQFAVDESTVDESDVVLDLSGDEPDVDLTGWTDDETAAGRRFDESA